MRQQSEGATELKTKVRPQKLSGKLSDKETQEVLALFKGGENAIDIAEAFGIKPAHVYKVTREAAVINGKRRTQNVTGSQIYALVEAQEFKCAISGDELTRDNAEADHMTPLSRGGSQFIENIQIVTKAVNRAKGTLTNEEFIELCCRVAIHTGRCKAVGN